MSGWEVGDLALCVSKPTAEEANFTVPGFMPEVGGIYQVSDVGTAVHVECGHEMFALAFEEDEDQSNGWNAARFRKVTPPAADEFDREVIEQMNGAPVGEPIA